MQRATSQQLRDAWRNASRTGIYALLFAGLLYFLLMHSYSVAHAGLWLTVIFSLGVARMLLGVHFQGSEDETKLNVSYWLYLLMTTLVAMSWGCLVFLLTPSTPYLVVFTVMVSAILVSVIGMISSYTVLLGSLVYLLTVSILQITWLYLYQPQGFILISLLLFFYTLGMLAVMLILNRQYSKLMALDQGKNDTSGENQFKGLVEASPDAILVTDQDGKISFANQVALAKFGYRKNEILGMPVQVLIPEFDQELDARLDSANSEAETNRAQKAIEIFCRQKNGEIFSADIKLIPTAYGEESFYIYVQDTSGQKHIDAFIKEIREKENMERQLQQAQKMEALGQLTGGVAHDFNNTLASMLGYTELAMFKADKENEKLVEYLSNIYDAGEKAKELVGQMLTFSRKVKGEKQAINLGTVVQEAVKMVRPMLPSSIQVNAELEKSMPLVEGDTVQLNQTLLNLIINARDAIGEKGEINISIQLKSNVDSVCSSCLQSIGGELLELSVSDTGSGIVYERVERIFEPFNTSKDVGRGTGMGLAMVHGIVHEHGGHVVVETERGKGSKFKLYFPVTEKIQPAEINESSHKKSDRLHGKGRRVMVVDDELMVVKLLNEILTSYHYYVDTYCDSADALTAYKSNPQDYDLIITDHTMPKMTGAELSQNILRLNPDQPIILCTGYSDYIDEEKAEELGIAAFMHKPLDHSELMHTVDLLTHTGH